MSERSIIPYHIRVCLEGIPHHAWFKEVADLILGDEAIIHHVEEESRRRANLRAPPLLGLLQRPIQAAPSGFPYFDRA